MTNLVVIWMLATNPAVLTDFKAHDTLGRYHFSSAANCIQIRVTSWPLTAGEWSLDLRPRANTNLAWISLDARVSVPAGLTVTNEQLVTLPHEMFEWREPIGMSREWDVQLNYELRRRRIDPLPPLPKP